MLQKDDLVRDLKAIGIEKGDLLHLKVSMRSVGKVEGGAETLLEAILEAVGKEGTIVCDSFISTYKLPLKGNLEYYQVNDKTPTYAGAFAQIMVNHPDNIRSRHPIQKFSAIGARARELMLSHQPGDFAYKPLLIMAEEGAKNLTIGKNVIGVGTTHLAVEKVGLVMKKPDRGVVYENKNGELDIYKIDWNGGCGKGFRKFIPLYEKEGGIIKHGRIGNADSILTDMKKTLEIEYKKINNDTTFFLCNDPTCKSCRLRWEHAKSSRLLFYYNILKKKFVSFFKGKKLSV